MIFLKLELVIHQITDSLLNREFQVNLLNNLTMLTLEMGTALRAAALRKASLFSLDILLKILNVAGS